MFLTISFLSGFVGICFAGLAALLPDTGIDGTLGSFLALLGTVVVTLAVGMLVTDKVLPKTRGVLFGLAAIFTVLTALAAWFLMQDSLKRNLGSMRCWSRCLARHLCRAAAGVGSKQDGPCRAAQ